MSRDTPIFFSALMLTGVHLLLRLIGTSFQVYISNQIGASGVGLLQLVMSVGSLAMVAGMAGIRTGSMYLTAEELGKKRQYNIPWVLSGCFLYSIICSGAVAVLLYSFSPVIAERWIGDIRTVSGLKLYAAFLPAACLCGVMTGYFTAANRIGTLAAVEVAEQFVSMGITVIMLTFWAGNDPSKACQSVIMGSCIGTCFTVICLSLLYSRNTHPRRDPIPVRSRLMHTAVPLAFADILKSGINTTENLMVPKRLMLHPQTVTPLAAFGVVTGMVFPVIMFPACILFGLAELLIPELARCTAAGSNMRVRYLVKRSLKAAMLYGLCMGGLLFFTAQTICMRLYNSTEAVQFMKWYAVLIPMLYCDAITDAMTKGLGQQKICVRYNIVTSAMDVVFLYFLLPKYGMNGYFASFAITHFINFILSLRRLLKITKQLLPLYIPFTALSAAVFSATVSRTLPFDFLQIISYFSILLSVLTLFKIIGREDFLWVLRLLKRRP